MKLNFLKDGVCHVMQEIHFKDLIDSWPEEFKDKDKVSTPTSLDLFEKVSGALLGKEKSEVFHSVTTKGIFMCTRSRPDDLPTVSVLAVRVREPNQSDWEKGLRFVR